MRKVEITGLDSFATNDDKDMINAGLKIGDIIYVTTLCSNAVSYKPDVKTPAVIIYTWNIKDI